MRTRIIGIGIAAALTVAAPASAATIQVTDDGDGVTGCTLRAAINAANGSGPTGTCAAGDPAPATDRIELPANLQFTATSLGAGEDANATGDLDILGNVDIVGQGAAITGSGDRVIDIHGAAVHITGATISGGVTPAGEDGGGIDSVGALTLTSSVVSGNRTGGCAAGAANAGGNCVGANVTDGGHNLDFPDSADCPGTDADPKLGPLQDNGGPTFTRAIATDGAAIDQVPASGAGCPVTDQRGHARPQRGACDIGAFEVGADPTPPPGGDGTPPGGDNPPVSTEPTRLTVRLFLRTQKLPRALRRGYSARFDASQAAKAVLEVWVEGRATRGLRSGARKRIRVARGTRSLTTAGRGTVTARFTRKSRDVLKRRSKVRVRVILTVTDTSGGKSVKSKRLTLRR